MKVLLIVVIVFLVWWYIRKEIKSIKEPNVYMVTGGVKTGKTTLVFHLARKRYRRLHRRWFIKSIFCRIFRKDIPEEPLFYTNVPVKWKHVLITRDMILRKVRPNYKSVAVIQEASLMADSMDFKDDFVNEQLKLFFKLWGHETKGGYLYCDTQNLKDVHYNVKRCMTSYLWIHHSINWLPFFHIMRVREMYYSDEQGVINNFDEDTEEKTKLLFIPKRVHKYFDSYCYSILTDNLPLLDNVIADNTYLKADKILTVKDYKKENNKNENREQIKRLG